jgi:iron-sulfur cluster insertion protein
LPDGTTNTEAQESSIVISDNAARRIGALIEQESQGRDLKFRVTVSGGGCSGFQYGFDFDESINDDDIVFEHGAVKVLVDDVSLQFLGGAVLEYKEELIGSFFALENPNASSTCGCGTSFSI